MPQALNTLDRDNLARLYQVVHIDMLSGSGYQPFGYDWRTMRLTHPEHALLLKVISNAHKDNCHVNNQRRRKEKAG